MSQERGGLKAVVHGFIFGTKILEIHAVLGSLDIYIVNSGYSERQKRSAVVRIGG